MEWTGVLFIKMTAGQNCVFVVFLVSLTSGKLFSTFLWKNKRNRGEKDDEREGNSAIPLLFAAVAIRSAGLSAFDSLVQEAQEGKGAGGGWMAGWLLGPSLPFRHPNSVGWSLCVWAMCASHSLPLCGLGRKKKEEKRMKGGQGGGRGRRRRRIKGAEDPTKIGRQRRKGLLNSCFVILTDLEGRKMLIEEPERGMARTEEKGKGQPREEPRNWRHQILFKDSRWNWKNLIYIRI